MAFVACSGFLYQIVASGDVTGDLPGPLTVAKLQGRTLDSAAPSTGNTITWDGSKWLPAMFSWSNLTGTAPNISTFANNSGYLTTVAWSAVTGKPTGVLAFTNDAGYLTASGTIALADSAAQFTGPDQYNIMVGGSTATALVNKTVDNAILHFQGNINVTNIYCSTDAGSLTLRVYGRNNVGTVTDLASGLGCSTSGGTSSTGVNYPSASKFGYEISSVSGSPTTLSIAIKFNRY